MQIHKFKDKSAKFSCPVMFCGFRNVMNFKLWQISPLDNFSWFATPYSYFPLSLNDFWNAKCVHDQIHDSINRLLLPRCDPSENFKLLPSFQLLEFITKTSKPFPLELMLSFLVFERQELIFFFFFVPKTRLSPIWKFNVTKIWHKYNSEHLGKNLENK